MASSKRSQSKHSLTSHGVLLLSTGVVLVLLWRATGGSGTATTIGGIIILGLLLVNYQTVITQIEGV